MKKIKKDREIKMYTEYIVVGNSSTLCLLHSSMILTIENGNVFHYFKVKDTSILVHKFLSTWTLIPFVDAYYSTNNTQDLQWSWSKTW